MRKYCCQIPDSPSDDPPRRCRSGTHTAHTGPFSALPERSVLWGQASAPNRASPFAPSVRRCGGWTDRFSPRHRDSFPCRHIPQGSGGPRPPGPVPPGNSPGSQSSAPSDTALRQASGGCPCHGSFWPGSWGCSHPTGASCPGHSCGRDASTPHVPLRQWSEFCQSHPGAEWLPARRKTWCIAERGTQPPPGRLHGPSSEAGGTLPGQEKWAFPTADDTPFPAQAAPGPHAGGPVWR